MKKTLFIVIAIMALIVAMVVSSTAAAGASGDIANVSITSSSITWTPTVSNLKAVTLTIMGPSNYYFRKQYGGSAAPSISSGGLKDGSYTYELVLSPKGSQDSGDQSTRGLNASSDDMTQSGAFAVSNGSFVKPKLESGQSSTSGGMTSSGGVSAYDQVIADDLIVQGSECLGVDCVNGESFGFDTLRLKENNTRIKFEDTSVGSFPSNDWTIVANDSSSGGANYLAFEDTTGGKTPFKVTAGAATNSLFVSSAGRVGLGTSAPVLKLHLAQGDTPGIRLEQNNSSGYSAQTWDMAGNETNFFVRDVTNGSKLPFRIRPGAPTSSIDVAASGDVGIGTSSPQYKLDVATTGENALLAVRRTDNGSIIKFAANLSNGAIGTVNDFPVVFTVNNTSKMTLDSSGNLTTIGSMNATAFNTTSDKNVKENFGPINQATILDRLANMPISTWNFIADGTKTKHMGPMAQDFYAAFGLGADDKHIATVDADGVTFAAIQELNTRNQALSSENAVLHSQVDDLAARVSALESGSSPSGQSSQNILIVLLVGMNLGLIGLLFWAMRRGFLGMKADNR